jgi:hypothetical protein
MSPQEQAQVTSRLRHALIAFKQAQTSYLSAHRQLKNQSAAEVDAFWDGAGLRLEAALKLSAKELLAAFKLFSAAGLVASANDRHLVTEAKRSLEQDAA